jgi:[ribosomal protein S5]-alanine N-acetyltransferase
MTTPSLETPRLILRPLSLADADQIQRIFPHWDVVKYLNDRVPWPYPADGARQFIEEVALPAVARGGEWLWTLRLKSEPNQAIGIIHLKRGDTENRGFWIGVPWQGQGLMTEAVEVVTDFWFNTLMFAVLRVPKATANTASRRMSERSGMRVVATIERGFVAGVLPADVWEITAEEWNARRIF